MKSVWLYLENGIFLEAKSFGADITSVGELVFNTSMTGYQEIASDPSYAGQFITFTMPEIGNVGINDEDMESQKAFCKGVILRQYQDRYSNFRAQDSLASMLKKYNVLGICDIDTRYLTKILRSEGSMMMIASTSISDKATLKRMLESSAHIQEIDYIEEVSTKTPYIHKHGVYDDVKFKYTDAKPNGVKIVAIDFGIKQNILNELTSSGFEVEVIAHNFSADDLISRFQNGKIKGVFLSNGPGDPLMLKNEQREIAKLSNANIPIFGICLGHQLLSIAHGYDTFKLKFGHHGGNHPVKNSISGVVEITAQNHNYNVPDEIVEIADITHVNLFDKTIEGLRYKNKPILSVQHHPESSPGPKESRYIFNEFRSLVDGHKQ